MAIKKNELYSSLWASCDKLRGGMDASQYKDYILTLLFVKYVTDKFQGVKYADITVPEGGSFNDLVALKGNKNIGEEMDKVIAKLAEAGENNLRGVIDNAHFNDEAKLGSGKEMVDKLTGLIAIFQRDEFNFKKNKASGDDILGDAYEYLMRHFATESGKSKGQFYTPAEVSRILAKVIGIDSIEERNEGYSVYDKTTPRLIQFHTLKNAANPPFLGGFSIFGTVAAGAEQRSCQGDSLFSMILCNDRKAIVTE